jgi:hypothetical protein
MTRFVRSVETGKTLAREYAVCAAAFGFALAAAIALPGAGRTLAQTHLSSPIDGQVPAREGNIYGHQDHQPNERQETAAGLAPPTPADKRQVEQEVRKLLEQTDALDRWEEQQELETSGAAGPNFGEHAVTPPAPSNLPGEQSTR